MCAVCLGRWAEPHIKNCCLAARNKCVRSSTTAVMCLWLFFILFENFYLIQFFFIFLFWNVAFGRGWRVQRKQPYVRRHLHMAEGRRQPQQAAIIPPGFRWSPCTSRGALMCRINRINTALWPYVWSEGEENLRWKIKKKKSSYPGI